MMKPLNNQTVNRRKHPVRILQFGEGNFLRAFFDWMIEISNTAGVTDSAVAIVSPRFKENATIRNLREQDGLFHVCLEGIGNGSPKQETKLVESVAEAVTPLSDPDRYLELITSPHLRFIISNTTEAGIRFEQDDPSSLQASTFPGKITALLLHRFRHFKGDPDRGLIILCCELIEDNGKLLKECVIRHAREGGLGEDFIGWVDDCCIFCDTLVDRIVSGFPADSAEAINEATGYADDLLVKGELYHLWVIGGERVETVKAELPLHKAGLNVHFLPSVSEFRDRKVRVLNGCHTGMVPVALQLGCETVLDAFSHRDVNSFITLMVEREILPAIDGDPRELRVFADGILERFRNPYIRHLLKSISLNSLSKWEARNFPTVRDLWKREGRHADFGLFTFAALLSLYAPGSGFNPEDNPAHLRIIRENWDSNDIPSSVERIVKSGIFIGDFEKEVPGFCGKVAEYVGDIRGKGMPEALQEFLSAQ